MEQNQNTQIPPEETGAVSPGLPQQPEPAYPPKGYAPAPPAGWPAAPYAAADGGAGQAPPPPVSGWPGMYGQPPQPRKNRRRMRPVHIAIIAISVALMLLCAMVLFAVLSLNSTIGGLFATQSYNNSPPQNSFSVITVVGTIQSSSSDALGINDPSYHHSATVNYIKQLTASGGGEGILLYMNTPGGGVYESDEVYLALMDYKEQTGKPIWAFMGPTCASGGYYICAAADRIVANRNTTTGSIGVYISLTDTSGLYEKLGIETVLVRSGENKGTGTSGVPITAGQRDVYQSIVDESYEQFLDCIVQGRGMDYDDVRELADGRVYTGKQALGNGLIDDLGDWDSVLAEFTEETGASAFYPNFSSRTLIGRILGSVLGEIPQGEVASMLSMAEKYPQGVPMALYDPGL